MSTVISVDQTTGDILKTTAKGKVTIIENDSTMFQRLREEDQIMLLKQQQEVLKAKVVQIDSKRTAPSITFKVSAKGAVSVYGLGRFPVTLYKEQWERLLDKIDGLKTFIKENDKELTVKEKKTKK